MAKIKTEFFVPMYRNGEIIRNKKTGVALRILGSYLEDGIVMYHYMLETTRGREQKTQIGVDPAAIGIKTQSDVIRFGAQLKISEIKYEK